MSLSKLAIMRAVAVVCVQSGYAALSFAPLLVLLRIALRHTDVETIIWAFAGAAIAGLVTVVFTAEKIGLTLLARDVLMQLMDGNGEPVGGELTALAERVYEKIGDIRKSVLLLNSFLFCGALTLKMF